MIAVGTIRWMVVALLAAHVLALGAAAYGRALGSAPARGGDLSPSAVARAVLGVVRIALRAALRCVRGAWPTPRGRDVERESRLVPPHSWNGPVTLLHRTIDTLALTATGPFRLYALARSYRGVQDLAARLRRLHRAPCPRWLAQAARHLRLALAGYGVEDCFQVRFARSGPRVLGWYPCLSQFEAGRPVFALTPEFVEYVLAQYERAGGDRKAASARDLTRSGMYVLAHEYGHAITELAAVLHLCGGAARVGLSTAMARRLWVLLREWRTPDRGSEEAFCDDLAAFVRGADPSFLDDDAVALRHITGPRVKLVLRLHAALVSRLTPADWRVLRDVARARILGTRRWRALEPCSIRP